MRSMAACRNLESEKDDYKFTKLLSKGHKKFKITKLKFSRSLTYT
jgi:hypothetical protein